MMLGPVCKRGNLEGLGTKLGRAKGIVRARERERENWDEADGSVQNEIICVLRSALFSPLLIEVPLQI